MGIVGAFMVPHPPLIVEEIGRGKEKVIMKTIEAYKEVARRISALKPETIVVASPHSVLYADYFHIAPGLFAEGNFGDFGAESVLFRVPYDYEFTNELVKVLKQDDFSGGTMGEREKSLDHGSMVPLYFINQEYDNYKIVRISLSGLCFQDHYTLGQYVKAVGEKLKRKVVFIASGDLSHRLKEEGPYGFRKEGPLYDEQIMNIMGTGNFMELFHFDETFCDKAAECGHRSFLIMAGALDKTAVTAELLSYEGPFGVGYGVCAFDPVGKDENRNFKEQYEQKNKLKMEQRKATEDEYVRLARLSLESYVTSQKIAELPEELPNEMKSKQAGIFVSIKKNGQLRGCIGTISPTKSSIAEEIIYNAISAGTQDPRFHPVEKKELKELIYSVDELGKTESISSKDELDVKRFGVIVSRGMKRGLLLPNLEGVDTIEEQISIAKKKAGINESADVTLERFEVVRHI